jgi:hypothetical protein
MQQPTSIRRASTSRKVTMPFAVPLALARTLPEELQRLLGDSGFPNRKRGVTVPSYRTA